MPQDLSLIFFCGRRYEKNDPKKCLEESENWQGMANPIYKSREIQARSGLRDGSRYWAWNYSFSKGQQGNMQLFQHGLSQ